MASSFDRLARFLREEMRMSHIYQPLMLRTIIENGGKATTRQIAAAFLEEDESQLEYYETITNRMPGKVLRDRGIVVREGDGYALNPNIATLTSDEARSLVAICFEAIAKFKAARGAALWQHRAVGLGNVPGTLRYETLKRAGFRCELCGVPADERALDVDHIMPRKAGGPDTPENFQALCWLCNTNKGAGDDADFRRVAALHSHRESGCTFCEIPRARIIAENSRGSHSRHRDSRRSSRAPAGADPRTAPAAFDNLGGWQRDAPASVEVLAYEGCTGSAAMGLDFSRLRHDSRVR